MGIENIMYTLSIRGVWPDSADRHGTEATTATGTGSGRPPVRHTAADAAAALAGLDPAAVAFVEAVWLDRADARRRLLVCTALYASTLGRGMGKPAIDVLAGSPAARRALGVAAAALLGTFFKKLCPVCTGRGEIRQARRVVVCPCCSGQGRKAPTLAGAARLVGVHPKTYRESYTNKVLDCEHYLMECRNRAIDHLRRKLTP